MMMDLDLVASVIEAIEGGNYSIDDLALAELVQAAQAGHHGAKSALAELLANDDAANRTDAIYRICDSGAVALSGLVALAVRDSDPLVRASAVEALGLMAAEQHADVFVEALADEDSDVRSYAAAALGNTGDADVLPALERFVAESMDAREVAEGCVALIRLGRTEYLARLLTLLVDASGDDLLFAQTLNAVGDIPRTPTVPAHVREALAKQLDELRKTAHSLRIGGIDEVRAGLRALS